MSQKIPVQCSSYHFSCFKLLFFSKQLHINLSSPRLIGFDTVTKKLFKVLYMLLCLTIAAYMYTVPYEGFNY